MFKLIVIAMALLWLFGFIALSTVGIGIVLYYVLHIAFGFYCFCRVQRYINGDKYGN